MKEIAAGQPERSEGPGGSGRGDPIPQFEVGPAIFHLARFLPSARKTRDLLLVCLSLWAATLVPALTIATYNLENYLVADRMVEGVFRPGFPKPEKEREALVTVVRGLAADILAVQEMGPQPYLDDFQQELRAAGIDYPYATLLEAADPDRHVAVLSRIAFKEVRRHRAVPITYLGRTETVKRGVLEAVFAAADGDFSLFVVHLKSRHTERKDDPESASQRRQEAVAVRDLVLSRYPDPVNGRFVLCGDWNDTRTSKTVVTLTKGGSTPLGVVLPAADSHGETWTHFFRRDDSYSRIDYLLVSAALAPFVAGNQATVYDRAGVREASDHRPVVVRLQLEAEQ